MREIDRLAQMLKEAHIPFDLYLDGPTGAQRKHLLHPKFDSHVCSVIQGYNTYGNEQNLLEIFGLTDTEDDVEGWLSASEVFDRIKAHWGGTPAHVEG